MEIKIECNSSEELEKVVKILGENNFTPVVCGEDGEVSIKLK